MIRNKGFAAEGNRATYLFFSGLLGFNVATNFPADCDMSRMYIVSDGITGKNSRLP